jgi:carbonic anhydrase
MISPATDTAHQSHLTAASAKYSATFTKGHLPLPPGKKYLVLTCMDARIDPAEAFGIELGDAHVVRNVSEIPCLCFTEVERWCCEVADG